MEFWIRINATNAPRDTVKQMLSASRRGPASEAQLLLTQAYEGSYYARMGNIATRQSFADALTARQIGYSVVSGPPAALKTPSVAPRTNNPLPEPGESAVEWLVRVHGKSQTPRFPQF